MGKSKRKALVFLIDQMQLAEDILSTEELGELYIALRKYATKEALPDKQSKSVTWNAVFGLLARAQDKAETLYEETCARNRAAARARWDKAST